MATDQRHVCDDECVCPIHGTPLFYWPKDDDHACQDISCRYAHGMADLIREEMPALFAQRSRRSNASLFTPGLPEKEDGGGR